MRPRGDILDYLLIVSVAFFCSHVLVFSQGFNKLVIKELMMIVWFSPAGVPLGKIG